jgi:HK97 family phage major capsid protein
MAIKTWANSPWGVEEWSHQLLEKLIRTSALLAAPVTRVESDGRVVYVPRLKLQPSAEWVAELEELPSNAGEHDTVALVPRKIGNVIEVSRESIEDASVGVLDALGTAMVKGLSHALDSTAFGTAAEEAKKPAGLLHGLAAGVEYAHTGHVDIDNILEAIGKIEGHGGTANAIFINSEDLTTLRKQKSETGGAYMLLPGGSLTGDITQPGVETIAGARLFISPGIAQGSVLVADAQYIQLAIRRNMEVAFSEDALFTSDAVVARVTARLDWEIGDPNALCLIGEKSS